VLGAVLWKKDDNKREKKFDYLQFNWFEKYFWLFKYINIMWIKNSKTALYCSKQVIYRVFVDLKTN